MTYKYFKCKKTMKDNEGVVLFKKGISYELNTYMDSGGICETGDYICLPDRKLVDKHFIKFRELGE